ncbi:hypothetical protein [Aurantiacibacter sp. D1-12]|uniref:hypothetical protein n=1 Tax=Aurantiacibacter sp. D1-12 TaxID=2993658 RepID=UPI00237D1673|nr:hypothetical protein [Aurantiacibacter sp. D1-12]MDE1466707.1 hypothetical protein [Aurantiacibacter sp. D1-12]
MASRPFENDNQDGATAERTLAKLADPKRAIATPFADAFLLWGAPVAVLCFLALWLKGTELALGASSSEVAVYAFLFATMITYGHLVAVVPRAYLNQDVFSANRFRLTVVPVVLIAALAVSPTVFIIAGIVAFFWDVHHSAMQTFGIARIYDFKAGNGPTFLRRTDLLLNWMLYVGPIFVGASFVLHADQLSGFADTPLTVLATAPGYLEAGHAPLRNIALGIWAVGIVWAVVNYGNAVRQGYKIPPHKVALIAGTGAVTFLAWGFLPPLIAFATINIHHAVQYYVIVWVQEGKRITEFTRLSTRAAFAAFVLFTAVIALGYDLATKMDSRLMLVPFLACSLLHFWYDGFVWSVRKKSV